MSNIFLLVHAFPVFEEMPKPNSLELISDSELSKGVREHMLCGIGSLLITGYMFS